MADRNMRDLSFATFNLLNLQVPGGLTYGSAPFPDDDEGRRRYGEKVDWTGAMLRSLDAEVIGFQECWSVAALDACFDAADLRDRYDIVARDAAPYKPQVALAVRKDRNGESQLLPGAEWVESFPDAFRLRDVIEDQGAQEEVTVTIDSFSRPILRARMKPEASRQPRPPEVELMVAHLKSKGPARIDFRASAPTDGDVRDTLRSVVSHVRRVMEAGALREMLERAPEEPRVVMGDLNDGSLSITTQLISGEPGYRVIEKSTKGNSAAGKLYSVERLQQYRSLRHVYYTYIFDDRRESLDHILVSPHFYDHARDRLWSFREMRIWNDHVGDGAAKDAGASDHGVVRAAFDWNPMPEHLTS
ncbi:MAG: endonuclease/exonuclease/phosphatase family protein [Pseudomonadota bacterium]